MFNLVLQNLGNLLDLRTDLTASGMLN